MFITEENPTYLQEKLETAANNKIRALRAAIQTFRMEAAAGYDTRQLVQAADRLNTQAAALHAACIREIAGKIPND